MAVEEQKAEDTPLLQGVLGFVVSMMILAIGCIAVGFVAGITWNLVCVGWRWAARLFPLG